jgi:hypothetical protein
VESFINNATVVIISEGLGKVYVQINRTPVIAVVTVIVRLTNVESSDRETGSVLCIGIPERVIRLTFPAGGIIVNPVTTNPDITGAVITLAPTTKEIISDFPGDRALSEADCIRFSVRSPENCI